MNKKKLIDLVEFEIQLNKFNRIPTWTKSKYLQREKLLNFLNRHENICYETSWINVDKELKKRWSYKILNIPLNKRGFLKKYRGLKILCFNIEKVNQFKVLLACLPLNNNFQ